MAKIKVAKVTSEEELAVASARFDFLNRKRLEGPLEFREENERKALDQGIQFYLLVKRIAGGGFINFSQVRYHLYLLKQLFDDAPEMSHEPDRVEDVLRGFGVVVVEYRFAYDPSLVKADFEKPYTAEGEQ